MFCNHKIVLLAHSTLKWSVSYWVENGSVWFMNESFRICELKQMIQWKKDSSIKESQKKDLFMNQTSLLRLSTVTDGKIKIFGWTVSLSFKYRQFKGYLSLIFPVLFFRAAAVISVFSSCAASVQLFTKCSSQHLYKGSRDQGSALGKHSWIQHSEAMFSLYIEAFRILLTVGQKIAQFLREELGKACRLFLFILK